MKKDRSNHASSANKTFGLPKADILRGRTNFKRLFEGSATVYSERCVSIRFRIFPGSSADCKMGFITAKRLGPATKRNRTKRLLKEAYRLNRHPLSAALTAASVGFHGVLIAKTVEMDFTTAEKEVVALLARATNDVHSTFDL